MRGVYLSIPVINKYVSHSSLDEIRDLVLIIFISSIIYQLFSFYDDYFYLNLNFFLSSLCYLMLGYYFSRREYNISSNKIITICLVLFLCATLLKILGQLEIIPMDLVINFKPNLNNIIKSAIDVGPLELIQATSIFLLFKNIYKCKTSIYSIFRNLLETKYIKKFIISVSKASYGMYLINATFTSLCKNYVGHISLTGTEIVLCFAVLTVFVFFASWIIVAILGKIPFIKRFSEYA